MYIMKLALSYAVRIGPIKISDDIFAASVICIKMYSVYDLL